MEQCCRAKSGLREPVGGYCGGGPVELVVVSFLASAVQWWASAASARRTHAPSGANWGESDDDPRRLASVLELSVPRANLARKGRLTPHFLLSISLRRTATWYGQAEGMAASTYKHGSFSVRCAVMRSARLWGVLDTATAPISISAGIESPSGGIKGFQSPLRHEWNERVTQHAASLGHPELHELVMFRKSYQPKKRSKSKSPCDHEPLRP